MGQLAVPGGYRTLTTGVLITLCNRQAGSGGTHCSWEKTREAVGWASGPEICSFVLDQLGGIWEIIFWMTLPEQLPTELKRSF